MTELTEREYKELAHLQPEDLWADPGIDGRTTHISSACRQGMRQSRTESGEGQTVAARGSLDLEENRSEITS